MTQLPYRLTIHVPTVRFYRIQPLLPLNYHSYPAIGYWEGASEDVTIITIAGGNEDLQDALDRIALTLLELGEQAVYYELVRSEGGLLTLSDYQIPKYQKEGVA